MTVYFLVMNSKKCINSKAWQYFLNYQAYVLKIKIPTNKGCSIIYAIRQIKL